MGLSQSFKFKYNNISEIEKLLKELNCSQKNNLWVISEFNEKQMNFELTLEDYGLYTHRSGDYFEVLGLLLEKLTGKFGQVEVDDL